MNKRSTDQGNPRLATDRNNYNGVQERVVGEHPTAAIDAGILTPEGSLALDGGHLAGNKDQLHAGSKTHGHASPVPGASGRVEEEDEIIISLLEPEDESPLNA